MKEMTDEMAQFGPHRAIFCEWTTPEPCLKPVADGKAYCPECIKKVYKPAKKRK